MRIPTSGARRTLSMFLLSMLVVGLVACAAAGAPDVGGSGQSAPSAGAAAVADEDAGVDLSGRTSGDVVGVDGNAMRDDAKIIRSGSLQLDVADVRDALRKGRDLATGFGGYIGASQQYRDGDSITANVSYRLPVERWEEALDAFRGLGDPIGEQTDAIEVTDQIVDLDARIRNLKASETALVRHATEAVRIADLLEIESRLSDVRGQIEQLTAQQKNLVDRAAYATLDVTYGTEIAAVTKAASDWDPKSEVDRAGASLIGFLQALTSAGIWFAIVWLPILLGAGLVAGIVFLVARRLGLIRRFHPPVAPPPAAAEG
ncbi:MAG TPA: DUF4349 domain-containing protein [Candidatus Limnocylindrales bacterium]|nr:DUF4349 domain-containing protein [Candidatus Limnocylindrales bacterium]